MRTPRLTRTRLSIAVLAGAGALAVGVSAAPGNTAHTTAAKKITGKGVDGVKLGDTFQQLRAAGRIGKLRAGCEFAGPNARSAKLRAPLKGNVDFTQSTPRKVNVITVTGGAKARGVGVGSTIAQIQSAFPKAKVDHSTEAMFGITLVKIPKNGGGRFHFAVPTATGKADAIGIPQIAFCE
jgi:hypothetical protein